MSVSRIPKGVLAALRRWEKVDLISPYQAEGLMAPRPSCFGSLLASASAGDGIVSPFYLLDLAADGPRAPRVVH